MVITLMQDNSGEMMIRGSVTSDKNLLNSKAIVYRARTNLHNIEQQIRDSITNQAGIVSQLIVEMGRGSDLQSEYDRWNQTRTVTPEMQKREDSLRDVNESLNCYDTCVERLSSMKLIAEAIQKEIDVVCEQLGIE